MKISTGYLLPVTLVGTVSLGLSFDLSAQEESGNSGELEEVVVTASRREERAIDVPVSLSVIDVESAARGGVTSINGIADFVPSLQAIDAGGPGLGNLTIRGIYVGGAPTVGTYVGDVPYGGVVGGFASSLALDATLYDLDRIEVVRGPQGTLFGASSVGGVVRYIPKEPNLNEIDGYVSVDYSSTKRGGDNALIRGRFSAPIIEDKLAIAVSGYSEDAGGYINNALTGERDIDEYDYSGGRFAVKWAVTDSFTVVASAVTHEADYDSASYETFSTITGQPLFGALQTEFTAPRESEFDLYSLTADIDLGFATLTSVTSDQTILLDNVSDVTAQLGPLLPPGTTVALNSGDDTDRFTQELRLTSNADSRFEWIVGAYYTKQESDSFQITVEDPADFNLINLIESQEYEEIALFGNVTFAVSDRWEVTAGARWSDNENEISQAFSGLLSNPLLNDLNTSINDDVTTWLFNTTFKVNDDFNLYGRVASGYRPGGANLVLDIGGMTFGTPSFVPDELWSYEAGVKGRTPNGRLSYDVGVYFIDWDDAQIQFVNPLTGLGETGNAEGGISAWGIEASLSGELFDNFFITATLALPDIELDEDEPNLGGVDGERVPGNPDMTASVAADYLWNVSDALEMSFGATWRQSGDYTSNFDGAATGNFKNASYSHLDLRVGLDWGRFGISLYGTNVTNESDYQTVLPIAPGLAYGVVLRPPTYGANLRFNF